MTTPTKRLRKSKTDNTDVYEDVEEPANEATPKAPQQHALGTIPQLPPFPSKSGAGSVSSQSQQSSAASAGSKRKRGSPLKIDLAMAHLDEYEIQSRPMPKLKRLPESIRQLADDMHTIANGTRVISEGFKGWKDLLSNDMSSHDEQILDESGDRKKLGSDPRLEDVEQIQEQAIWNQDNQASEPDWNCFVHGIVLKLAERLSSYSRDIICANMYVGNVLSRAFADK